MKYVVLQNSEGEKTAICAFHPVAHKDIADQHKALGKPVSAGFVYWSRQAAFTLGRSESLDLSPADDDAALLTQANSETIKIGMTK